MLEKPRHRIAIAFAIVIGVGLVWIVSSRPDVFGLGEDEAPEATDTRWESLSPRTSTGAEGTWSFVDVAIEMGVDFTHTNGFTGQYKYQESVGAGVALFDYDGDGWLDIYFVNGNGIGSAADPSITNVLYRNTGGGRFEDVTAATGVGDVSYGQGCCAADYDNDGDVDLYVTNVGPDILYRNDGEGRFENVTHETGIANPGFGQCCAFFDFDGDGWLDIYVQNYLGYDLAKEAPGEEYVSPRSLPGAADLLYRNNGDGTFTEASRSAGIYQPTGRGMGLACADFDDDGDIDVFVANDGMANYYFVNIGNGTFVEDGLDMGLAYDIDGQTEASMGADVGDYDGDGKLDIVCPALWDQGCTLYKNRAGAFGDVSHWNGLAALTREWTGFSPNFLDVDNDGDLDLFLCNGAVKQQLGRGTNATYEQQYGLRDQLLINDGHGLFDAPRNSAGPHFHRASIGRGSAVGDLDNDGDLDIVVNHLRGTASVLRNDSPSGHWITLDLTTKTGNTDSIGAKIHITADDKRQTGTVRATGGYVSLNDRRPHFGIGDATRVTRIEIVWPDGSRQELRYMEADQILHVEQGHRHP